MSSGGSRLRPERGRRQQADSKKPPAQTGGFPVFDTDQFSGAVWMAGAGGVTIGAGAAALVDGEAL